MTTNDPDPLDSFLETHSNSNTLDSFLDGIPAAKTAPTKPQSEKFIFKYGPDGCILPSPEARARIAYQKSLTEDTCCSFQEWKDAGYWVKKGARSMFKDALGVPQFTLEQVTPPFRR